MPYNPDTPIKCYFAHPVTDYDTERELQAVRALEAAGLKVVNPNTPEHDVGYGRGGMDYFIGVVATCDALAFQRFPGGEIGAGVAKEIATAASHDLPIYEVRGASVYDIGAKNVPTIIDSALSVDATRALLAHLRATE